MTIKVAIGSKHLQSNRSWRRQPIQCKANVETNDKPCAVGGKAESKASALPEFVLASSSPRRQQLLREAGYRFVVIEPSMHEPDEAFTGLSPAQQAESLAYFKARAVADLYAGKCVLGADTIVAVGAMVLGKPADADDARTMLQNLSGTRHCVITGVALLTPDGRRIIASDATFVTMRAITPDEIEQYIASGEWMGKAGAYAIQETADRFVAKVEGSFSNIVGLPMELLARMLERIK